ncbi:MAG: SusE domain-containing protein [Spirosomataceae bacterium]
MKNIINKLLLLGLAGMLFTACEKDEIKAVLNSNANPSVTLSSQNVVLLKDNADKDALTIAWAKPDYGFPAGASYTVLIDKKGGNFSNAVSFATGTELKKTFKTADLNNVLLGMGLPTDVAADVDIKVESLLGAATKFSSGIVSMKATPYLDKLDLSTNLGVVGSAANNWGATPDLPFYKTDKANVFVAYVTLTDGEIKFRENNKWDVNYGGSNGTLAKGGDNIAVKEGNYRITVDLNTLKYTIDKFSWGIVGSATPSGWSAPDIKMAFDPNTDTFKAVAELKEGEMKFRQNERLGRKLG